MRNRKIWLAICVCSLLLGGCGKKQASQQTEDNSLSNDNNTQTEDNSLSNDNNTQTEDNSLSDSNNTQTGDNSLSDANNTQVGDNTNNTEAGGASSSDTSKARTGGTSSSGTSKTKTGNASSSSASKAKTGSTSSSGTSKAKTGNASSSGTSKVKAGGTSSSDTSKTKTRQAANSGKKAAKITKKEALAKALKHAGVKESSIKAKRIKKDYENGTAVYDVEFYANGKEYDYDIRISDGKILKHDYEIEHDFNGQGESQNKGGITKNEAKKIALAKVPGAKKIRIKKDRENGRTVYEGKIYYGNKEYEFEIDASTGKILSWEIDND